MHHAASLSTEETLFEPNLEVKQHPSLDADEHDTAGAFTCTKILSCDGNMAFSASTLLFSASPDSGLSLPFQQE